MSAYAVQEVGEAQLRARSSQQSGRYQIRKAVELPPSSPEKGFLSSCKSFFGSVVENLKRLDPFRVPLRLVESRLGIAVASYFYFIRFLFYLNAVVVAFFLVPVLAVLIWQPGSTGSCTFVASDASEQNESTVFETRAETCSAIYQSNLTTSNITSVSDIALFALDLLQGTGVVEYSFAFLGYYCNTDYFRSDLVFLAVLLAAYLVSFVTILAKSGSFFRTQAMSSRAEYACPFTTYVFSAWDFAIADRDGALRSRRTWRNKVVRTCDDLREEEARRGLSKWDRAKITLVRVLVTCIIIVLQASTALCIWYSRSFSQEKLKEYKVGLSMQSGDYWIRLFFEYFTSLVLAILNFVVPAIFQVLLSFCSLTLDWQVRLRIVSTIVLRMFSLCILVVTIFYGINYSCSDETLSSQCGVCQPDVSLCWETYFGQQIYKLMVLDLLLKFALWIGVEVPRKLLSLCDSLSWIGPKQFDLPTVVLDLVYLQTLSWLAMFFAPILPLILFVAYAYLFALMMVSVLYTCSTDNGTAQLSNSTSFFTLVQFLLFALVLLPVGTALSKFQPSQSCSPFRVWTNENYTMTDTLLNLLKDNSADVYGVFQRFGAAALWITLLTLLIITFSFSAQSRAKRKSIQHLQQRLSSIGKDKQFLIGRIEEFQAIVD